MMTSLETTLIPVLKDNYAYLIRQPNSPSCVVIDPGDAKPVLNYIEEHQLDLDQIWITHWHSDHIGGIEEISKATHCEVLGPKEEKDRIPLLTESLSDLDIFEWKGYKVKVFTVPGHTLGHIVYWFYEEGLLFSGDTLFCLGCGYLFEGTPEQMWCSLRKLRDLPGQTRVYCGHEYSEINADFALSVDPENQDLIDFAKEIRAQRAEGKPTLPTTLQKEILTNPFLRADLPYWKKLLNLEEATPVEIFTLLREKRNNFK